MHFLISSIYQTDDMKEPQGLELDNMFIGVHVMCVEWVHVLSAHDASRHRNIWIWGLLSQRRSYQFKQFKTCYKTFSAMTLIYMLQTGVQLGEA